MACGAAAAGADGCTSLAQGCASSRVSSEWRAPDEEAPPSEIDAATRLAALLAVPLRRTTVPSVFEPSSAEADEPPHRLASIDLGSQEPGGALGTCSSPNPVWDDLEKSAGVRADALRSALALGGCNCSVVLSAPRPASLRSMAPLWRMPRKGGSLRMASLALSSGSLATSPGSLAPSNELELPFEASRLLASPAASPVPALASRSAGCEPAGEAETSSVANRTR
mmetsp:Transcript_37257/g.81921  ORF Transcript_37257/g.81921 Transcript_37257/m.81921 type:complete len:225 (-) Transcript_37257:2656-3330(-)